MQSEIMGGSGFWGFNNITIKQAANAAITWGVSHIVPHAIWATRTLQGNPWLPDWFDENPWWPQMHLWSDFVTRASFINSLGHSAADVLLLNPMDSRGCAAAQPHGQRLGLVRPRGVRSGVQGPRAGSGGHAAANRGGHPAHAR